MWEFAANHPGWFFLYIMIVVPCAAAVIILLLVLVCGGDIRVSREESSPNKIGSHPNNSKVPFNEGKQSDNAGTTRH